MESQHIQIISLLQSSFLLHGLNSHELKILARKARIYTYPPGQILVEEGLINERIIHILRGLVKIYKITPEGKEVFIAVEKDNNYLGVMDLTEQDASATIETLQETKVLVFYKSDLSTLLQKHAFLWERMYAIVLNKLNEYRELQSLLLGNDLYQRTYLLLQHLSAFSSSHTVHLSQETIASIVNATRSRVSQTLNELQRQKKISISSKKIKVHG